MQLEGEVLRVRTTATLEWFRDRRTVAVQYMEVVDCRRLCHLAVVQDTGVEGVRRRYTVPALLQDRRQPVAVQDMAVTLVEEVERTCPRCVTFPERFQDRLQTVGGQDMLVETVEARHLRCTTRPEGRLQVGGQDMLADITESARQS